MRCESEVKPINTDGGGSTAGNTQYAYCNGSTVAFIGGGAKLGSRSRISGDFNADGLRNMNDAEALVAAYFQPRTWSVGAAGACVQGPLSAKADQIVNTIITEVVGDFTVECRLGGPTQLVVTFDQPVQPAGGVASPASVSVSSGSVTQVSIAGPVLTVDLAGADNASLFTLGFPGVQNLCAERVTQTSCFKVLAGDVDGSGVVNLSDMLAIRDMLNQTVSAANFRADVDTNGKLDLADMLVVRDRLNSTVAASCP